MIEADYDAFVASVVAICDDVTDAIGEGVKTQILAQTEVGRDYRGRIMPPYSRGYRKFREARSLRTDRRNLRVTGAMLDSLKYDKSTKELSVSDEEMPKAEGNQHIAPFIGVSDLDTLMMQEKANEIFGLSQ